MSAPTWIDTHSGQPATAASVSTAKVWKQPSPRGRVVFVHGIISHSGWYTQSCQALADHGMEVHFIDRRGSGRNFDRRGDIDCWTTWLDDVQAYLNALPSDCPKILGGISWGGKLAASLLRRQKDVCDALMLICPGIYAYQFPSPFTYRLLELARQIGLAGLRVPIPLRDPVLFTGVASWQHFIARDPLTLRKITIRFALADRELTRDARLAAPDIEVPTWMVLAGQDRIVDNEATCQFYDSIETLKKELKTYPDAAHTFEFEPDPTVYISDMVHWLEQWL